MNILTRTFNRALDYFEGPREWRNGMIAGSIGMLAVGTVGSVVAEYPESTAIGAATFGMTVGLAMGALIHHRDYQRETARAGERHASLTPPHNA
ncbi:MAG: hypothetical protein V4702_04140 [Patescibacteria group bacterium]